MSSVEGCFLRSRGVLAFTFCSVSFLKRLFFDGEDDAVVDWFNGMVSLSGMKVSLSVGCVVTAVGATGGFIGWAGLTTIHGAGGEECFLCFVFFELSPLKISQPTRIKRIS